MDLSDALRLAAAAFHGAERTSFESEIEILQAPGVRAEVFLERNALEGRTGGTSGCPQVVLLDRSRSVAVDREGEPGALIGRTTMSRGRGRPTSRIFARSATRGPSAARLKC